MNYLIIMTNQLLSINYFVLDLYVDMPPMNVFLSEKFNRNELVKKLYSVCKYEKLLKFVVRVGDDAVFFIINRIFIFSANECW